jgi:hypothetical protein
MIQLKKMIYGIVPWNYGQSIAHKLYSSFTSSKQPSTMMLVAIRQSGEPWRGFISQKSYYISGPEYAVMYPWRSRWHLLVFYPVAFNNEST